MIWLYRLFLFFAPPFILVRLWLRSRKNSAYRFRLIERSGVAPTTAKPGGIWVHAVSVGEFIAATPMIEALLAQYPDRDIIVTCTTPTASELIRKQFGSRIHHSYLPYDYRYFVNRFLRQMSPSLLIIMETELWPNLLLACQRYGVRLMAANMRISDRSIKSYQYIAPMLKPILAKVDVFSVQTPVDRDRISLLGAKSEAITVTGNVKYDSFADETLFDPELNKTLRINTQQLWCAASTHAGEDELLLESHSRFIDHNFSILLVLAPRHPERFAQVYKLAARRFNVEKWSDLSKTANGVLKADTQVLLLDTIGDLKRLIACADFCFVGGSLVDVGGHNILEACHSGVPVLFGPFMQNFKQAKTDVIEAGAGFQVESADQLVECVITLLSDEVIRKKVGTAGLNLIQQNQGALERTLSLIKKLI